jgi:hypothetical protein
VDRLGVGGAPAAVDTRLRGNDVYGRALVCARGTFAAKPNRLSMTDVQRNLDACSRGLRIGRFVKRPYKDTALAGVGQSARSGL